MIAIESHITDATFGLIPVTINSETKMYLTKLLKAADHPYLYGKGGRSVSRVKAEINSIDFLLNLILKISYTKFPIDIFQLNNELHHLNMSFVRHQKGLWPLFILGVGGSIFVGVYMLRLAMKTTEVNWTKAKDDRIINYYKNKQMKFLNPGGFDYTKMSDGRPLYGAGDVYHD